MAKSSKGQTHPQPQSASTGKFVTKEFADKHPKTTFTEKPKKKS